MRLAEIDGTDAVDQRVAALRANAASARKKATQLTDQANKTSAQAKQQRSRKDGQSAPDQRAYQPIRPSS